jgi:signal transduction histidine kinase
MTDSNKRSFPFLGRLSLRAKVTLVLLSISLGPLLITGMVNVNRALERGRKSEGAHFAQSAMSTAAAFDDLFEHVRMDLKTIARRFPAENFDFAAIRTDLRSGKGLRPSLDEWRDAPFQSFAGEEFGTFFLALDDGEVFYSSPYRNVTGAVKLTDHAWFKPLAENGGVTAGPLPKLNGSDRPLATVVVPLFGQGGKRVGYLGATVDSARLREITLRMFRGHSTLGEHGSLSLTAPNGVVIAHNDETKLGSVVDKELRQKIKGRTIEFTQNDETFLATGAQVGASGWYVNITAPIDQVYRFLHVLLRVLIVVTVTTFVFVLLLADYLARLLLRPIRELERGAEMIGSGALGYRIELDSHRGDELGRLARAFNQMGDNLQQSQKQVRAYSRSLETANEELDAMVYAITHDLRKSLRGIDSYANFLREDYAAPLGDSGLEMLSTITVNVERINQLADDLVGLVESERDRADNVTFDLNGLFTEVRERVLERREGEVLIRGNMPHLNGDRSRLLLVFEHLVDNGLKFNRHSVPTVELSCRDDGLHWMVDVSDNGIGIDSADHERIFELFQRLHPQDEFSGSGTGLNIARRIADDHRGRIEVTPVEGGGTTFTVCLPKDGSRLTSPGFRLTTDGRIEPVRKERSV